MAQNYFFINRSVFGSDTSLGPEKPYSNFEAWLWLIAHARWRDNCEVERGQIKTHYRSLATAWGWTLGKTQRYLQRLVADTRIETNSETKSITLTICNYDKYQAGSNETDTISDTISDTFKRQYYSVRQN